MQSKENGLYHKLLEKDKNFSKNSLNHHILNPHPPINDVNTLNFKELLALGYLRTKKNVTLKELELFLQYSPDEIIKLITYFNTLIGIEIEFKQFNSNNKILYFIHLIKFNLNIIFQEKSQKEKSNSKSIQNSLITHELKNKIIILIGLYSLLGETSLSKLNEFLPPNLFNYKHEELQLNIIKLISLASLSTEFYFVTIDDKWVFFNGSINSSILNIQSKKILKNYPQNKILGFFNFSKIYKVSEFKEFLLKNSLISDLSAYELIGLLRSSNLIKGHFINKNQIYINKKTTSNIDLNDLNLIEFGIIGYLSTFDKPNIKKISQMFSTSNKESKNIIEYLLNFLNIEFEISRNGQVFLYTNLDLPPLTNYFNLSDDHKRIIGHMTYRTKGTFSDLSLISNINVDTLKKYLYELVGMGFIKLNCNENEFDNVLLKYPITPRYVNNIQNSINKNKENIIQSIKSSNEIDCLQLSIVFNVSIPYIHDIIGELSYHNEIYVLNFHNNKYQTQLNIQSIKTIHCNVCEIFVEAFGPNCNQCGAQFETCVICKTPLYKNQKIITCHFCNNSGHKHHMEDWLKIQPECPICKNSLSTISKEVI